MHLTLPRPCPTVISKMGMRRVRSRADAAHLTDEAGHLARRRFLDGSGTQAVLVAEGQVVEQILDGGDVLLRSIWAMRGPMPLTN